MRKAAILAALLALVLALAALPALAEAAPAAGEAEEFKFNETEIGSAADGLRGAGESAAPEGGTAFAGALEAFIAAHGPEQDAADGDEATYAVLVVDQYGEPVPEAAVGFCVDTGCIPVETDEEGVAVYTGKPAAYHLRVVDAPDAYDFPDDTDVYVGPDPGAAVLTVTRLEG